MSLDSFFNPRSIALIGASADPTSISARPLRLLAQHGFAGSLYPVNPKYQELQGTQVFPSISAVPETAVDLALVAVPAPLVPGLLQECAQAGVRNAVVLSSGFAEVGEHGRQLQSQIETIARSTGMRIAGPNAEGFYAPRTRVCATFSPAVDPEHGFTPEPPGPIAVVSQSGGLGFAILTQARELGLGIGPVVSTGNEVDMGWLEYVDYLLDDPTIRVVLGFIEGLRPGHRLKDVARKAARLKKPLVVVKVGRTEAGGRAAALHTASEVGDEAAYAQAFAQLGILRVDDVDELLDLAAYLSVGRLPEGRRLAIVTTSGGAGAWLADWTARLGFVMPQPATSLQHEIASFIPSYGTTANPVDITAQAVFGGGFERALGLLAHSGDFDVVAGVGSMAREERFLANLPELRAALEGARASVVFYAYTRPSRAVMQALNEIGVPCYASPGRAARALSSAFAYREFLSRLPQDLEVDERVDGRYADPLDGVRPREEAHA